jgi:tetratricopeptide (TPR) repeat protein
MSRRRLRHAQEPSPRPRCGEARRALAGAVLALGLALGAGCASSAGPGTGAQGDAAAAPLPVDGTPELDFLIARDLEQQGRPEEALEAYARALAKDPESVYLLRQLAELSARQNHLREALGYAERAFALEPTPEVRLFLGTLYRLQKDVDDARRVLLVDGEPAGPDAALLLYGTLSDARLYEEARGVAEWLLEAEPGGLRGYFALADATEHLGDPAGAEAVLRRGLEEHPGDLSLYGALARARRDRGDREGEIRIYREMLAERPDHHATLLALAEAELALHRVDEALETFRRVERLYPSDLRTSLRVAFLEFERGRLQEARERFERALDLNPEAHEVAYFLGVTLRRMDDEEGAIAVFQRIPEDHARYAEARTQIAAIYEQDRRYEDAIEEVERARAVSPSRPLDLYYASLRAKAGDVEGALAFLDALLVESPDDVELLYNIGVIHGEARNVDEAIRTMKIVLMKDPDHAGALNYVGYTWAERGTNLDEAEAMISRALEIRPDDGFITDSLGWVYYMRARPLLESGRVDEGREMLERAEEELRKAVELTGGDPVISEHLGDVYLLRGQKERALRMYEEALALEPRFGEQPELLEKLKRLRDELGSK